MLKHDTHESDDDIDSLLKKAAQNLTQRNHEEIPQKHKSLIADVNGIAKLDPSVLLAQTEEAIMTRAEEKERVKGTDWFDLKTPQMTEAIKRDLQLIKMRSVLDPKRHYRKENTKTDASNLPKQFEMGTIISDHTESSAHKIKRKDRKETIVEELLNDTTRREYFKRKAAEIDAKKRSGGRAFYAAKRSRASRK